jgi:molybdate transport system substrate-binding protein
MSGRGRTGLVVLLVAALGCAGAGGPDGSEAAGRGAGQAGSSELTVFAAASLTDAFTALGELHEDRHPDVRLRFSFAGSQQLARQIIDGAPADVFASSSPEDMADVVAAGLVRGRPETFATNSLAIAVEPGNPLGVSGLGDLARSDLVLVLADKAVPAGRYAAQALQAAGVRAAPSSYETDVRAALGKVRLGEADAAIVYRSDVVAAAGAVDGVDIPPDLNVTASYPAAALTGGHNPAVASTFLELLRSPAGQVVLGEHGFTP